MRHHRRRVAGRILTVVADVSDRAATHTHRFWYAVEALHSVVYFAPEASTAYTDVGLRGWWMGYFASRAAALGPVGPAPVTAMFHGFAPEFVGRSLPAAWSLAPVEDVLGARSALASLALGRAVGSAPLPDLSAVVAGCVPAGRPLAAAHATLPRPADPVGALWWDCTVLREHRGDGHVAALTAAGIDGCEANVLMRGLDRVPKRQQSVRGWTDDAWAAAADRLRHRGLLDAAGVASTVGIALREDVERATDVSCAVASAAVGPGVIDAVVALARLVASSGAVPYPNPVGVPAV
jgi:hypothetical protein